MEKTEEIVIVGAGIAGLTTSLALHRLGVKSIVLESSSGLRAYGYGLVLSTNAWKALDALGIADSLRHLYLPLSFGKHEVRSVTRKRLLEILEREVPKGSIRYSSKVVSIHDSGSSKLVHLAYGSTIKAKVLIGCDGVNSVVANWLGLEKPIYVGRSSVRGLAEFSDCHGLHPQFYHYHENGIRFGYFPCDEKTVYWFMSFISSHQKDEDLKSNQANIKQFVLDKLRGTPAQRHTIVENTDSDNMSISAIKMRRPWDILFGTINKGNICVAGDALHPMTPDIGQGACSAFEDAIVLARCLGEALKEDGNNENEYGRMATALEKYAKERRWRSFVLVSVAYLTGKVYQIDGKVMGYLRDKMLSRLLLNTQLKLAEFDCGRLDCA